MRNEFQFKQVSVRLHWTVTYGDLREKTSTAGVVGLPRLLQTRSSLCSRLSLNYLSGPLKKEVHSRHEIIALKSIKTMCSLMQYLSG